jgi:hypothetical protein
MLALVLPTDIPEVSVDLALLTSGGDLSGQPTASDTWSENVSGEGQIDSSISPQERVPKDNTDESFTEPRLQMNRIRDQTPVWSLVPTFSEPTCHIDHLITDLVAEGRREDKREERNQEFSRKNFPSVESLLNYVHYDPLKPVASTIARHVARVIRVHTVPEKIALLYMMCILIRVSLLAV